MPKIVYSSHEVAEIIAKDMVKQHPDGLVSKSGLRAMYGDKYDMYHVKATEIYSVLVHRYGFLVEGVNLRVPKKLVSLSVDPSHSS